MIDYKYAKENINKYKFDYLGYLVILDSIRTLEIINSNNINEKRQYLKYLQKKYYKEIGLIQKNSKEKIYSKSIDKMNNIQLIEQLNKMHDILPAIGFISLGLEKKIGISAY